MFGTNKYGNRRITTEDGDFDSKKEYRRWCELKLLQRAGEITNLRRQVPFVLIPAQKVDGKTVERAVKYIADFVYNEPGKPYCTVEDTKGVKTKEYIIKRKLMLQKYGIRIKEV